MEIPISRTRVAVTVGIPAYNCEHTIADAIRSVFVQTYTHWELIVIDDGSTDRTVNIVREIKDPRVRVISDGINKGLPERLNQITRNARGLYVARMDGDDIMHPDRLKQQVEFMESNPKTSVLGSSAYVISEKSRVVGKRHSPKAPTPLEIFKRGRFIHPTVLFAKEWGMEHPYDREYPRAEDYELWCRTSNLPSFATLDQPLLYYREPSVIRIEAYRLSKKTGRRVLLTHGCKKLGATATTGLLVKNLMSEIVTGAAAGMGLSKLCTAQRSERISTRERTNAQDVLNAVRKAQVPGLR